MLQIDVKRYVSVEEQKKKRSQDFINRMCRQQEEEEDRKHRTGTGYDPLYFFEKIAKQNGTGKT